MSAMASQITSFTIVYSTVCSGVDQRKHQSSASLGFVWGIHRWAVNSPHKGAVTRKMLPFDDVIINEAAATPVKYERDRKNLPVGFTKWNDIPSRPKREFRRLTNGVLVTTRLSPSANHNASFIEKLHWDWLTGLHKYYVYVSFGIRCEYNRYGKCTLILVNI